MGSPHPSSLNSLPRIDLGSRMTTTFQLPGISTGRRFTFYFFASREGYTIGTDCIHNHEKHVNGEVCERLQSLLGQQGHLFFIQDLSVPQSPHALSKLSVSSTMLDMRTEQVG